MKDKYYFVIYEVCKYVHGYGGPDHVGCYQEPQRESCVHTGTHPAIQMIDINHKEEQRTMIFFQEIPKEVYTEYLERGGKSF